MLLNKSIHSDIDGVVIWFCGGLFICVGSSLSSKGWILGRAGSGNSSSWRDSVAREEGGMKLDRPGFFPPSHGKLSLQGVCHMCVCTHA